jgi:hypothetical protein
LGLGLDALDEDAVEEGGERFDGFEGCGLWERVSCVLLGDGERLGRVRRGV